MKFALWREGVEMMLPKEGTSSIPALVSPQDPRAVRYFSTAARYNAVAAELGYPSFEFAVKAGRMNDIIRRAEGATTCTRR